MSPINYRLRLPTQWSIHDVFHIDLLMPYQETELHRSNYLRPAPDLIGNKEEYEVEKILDSQQFGRRHKRQYLIKWKGYPDSDNKWVDKRDVHALEAIREFEDRNSAATAHISRGNTSEFHIPSSSPSSHLTHKPSSSMTDVNNYYLGLPERIFEAELESGLITLPEAWELCAKKYIRPHIKDKDLLIALLTEQELGAVLLKFPDLDTSPMPPCALSPMVQQLSDPDGMGATPTHQCEAQAIDADIWGPEDSRQGEIPLPVPLRESRHGTITKHNPEGMLDVEGRAVCKSHCEEKCEAGSMGSTAPGSTLATRGPWSRTTSHMSEDIYPAKHPFIHNLKDSDDPDETPYMATTSGYPLYKGSYRTRSNMVPVGFKRNDGDNFISFPIKGLDGDVKQAEYVQVILHLNPIVIGLQDDSDKVYTKPLYAMPIFHYTGKPVYKVQELELLKKDAKGEEQTNCMIHQLHDPSLTAEVHRFHMVSQEIDHLEEAMVDSEDRWGELAAMQLKTIQRLEMADALLRIKDQDDGLVDNILRSVGESAQRGH